MKSMSGFTLMELLITISIMALLSAIAYPSYRSVIIKVRRSEAQAFLTAAQLKQSEYHILHPDYLTELSALGLPSTHAFYQFSVESASMQGYLLKAEVKSGSSQTQDNLVCQTLFIDQNDNKTRDGKNDNAECWQD